MKSSLWDTIGITIGITTKPSAWLFFPGYCFSFQNSSFTGSFHVCCFFKLDPFPLEINFYGIIDCFIFWEESTGSWFSIFTLVSLHSPQAKSSCPKCIVNGRLLLLEGMKEEEGVWGRISGNAGVTQPCWPIVTLQNFIKIILQNFKKIFFVVLSH